jgi:hypothetical protein
VGGVIDIADKWWSVSIDIADNLWVVSMTPPINIDTADQGDPMIYEDAVFFKGYITQKVILYIDKSYTPYLENSLQKLWGN